MVLGLGSGTTTQHFIALLGASLQKGAYQNILAIPTSDQTAEQVRSLDIPLTTLAQHPQLDLVIDSADEVDPRLNLLKGLGRALLREKILAIQTNRFVVIVDESKISPRLGSRAPLPVEIACFEAESHVRWLNTLGCRAELWLEPAGDPILTDNGNYLARCWFETGILDEHALARLLADRPGIIEHGLFLGMASQVVVAATSGIRILERDHCI